MHTKHFKINKKVNRYLKVQIFSSHFQKKAIIKAVDTSEKRTCTIKEHKFQKRKDQT